jgi:hypothetical protein
MTIKCVRLQTRTQHPAPLVIQRCRASESFEKVTRLLILANQMFNIGYASSETQH